MSTVQVSNITDGTNSVETVYVARGSAKAWGNLNGVGTIALRDSLNVASVVDNGVGHYTFNYTSAFAAADYGFLMSSTNTSSNLAKNDSPQSYSASAFVFYHFETTSPTLTDTSSAILAVQGDLA